MCLVFSIFLKAGVKKNKDLTSARSLKEIREKPGIFVYPRVLGITQGSLYHTLPQLPGDITDRTA